MTATDSETERKTITIGRVNEGRHREIRHLQWTSHTALLGAALVAAMILLLIVALIFTYAAG